VTAKAAAPAGQPRRVLIVEDEKVFAQALRKRMARNGFVSECAGTLREAGEGLRAFAPDLVLLDMRLPDGSGLEFLQQLRERQEEEDAAGIPVLVMSAYGEVEDAVEAMKLGAADYLKKPFDLNELQIHIERVLSRDEMRRRLDYSSARERRGAEGEGMLGESPAMTAAREQLRNIAKLTRGAEGPPPTVLLTGETGAGKDVAARLLHSLSARRESPFVHVDCAALPKDLIEAELFGHEKGAFTNAHVSRTGLIEASEDGALFLDEIGEVPLELQAKLLAVLERRAVRRVGSTRERPVASWFIAASNRDLMTMAGEGSFRSDLYYRLNVLNVRLPPLRERGDDILLLAEHFAGRTARRYGLPSARFEPGTRERLRDYRWPGNVRELRHMIERAVLLGNGVIDAAGLALPAAAGAAAAPPAAEAAPEAVPETAAPPPADAPPSDAPAAGNALDAMERKLIADALERSDGNVSRAARELGVTRMTLRYRMQKHGLD